MITFDFGPTTDDRVPAHLSTDPDQVRHALSSKEGWASFAARTIRRPKPITAKQHASLDDQRRAAYDTGRIQFHRSLVIARHSQLTEIWKQMQCVVMGQSHDDGPGIGIALTGGPGHGKTATTVGFCREYESQMRAQHPAAFHQENEFIPVCYSSLIQGAGLKAQMQHILRFYGHPHARRATGAELVDELVTVLNACRTQILVLDQAQNLHAGDRRDDQVAACLKEIMDAAHVTLVLTGIDLDETGPLAIATGGRLQASNDRLQLARRFTVLRLERVAKDSQEWRDLLSSIEGQLVLTKAQEGDISESLADYVWDRAQGAIGVTFNMLRIAANNAIEDGSERITRRLLNRVPLTIEAARTERAA